MCLLYNYFKLIAELLNDIWTFCPISANHWRVLYSVFKISYNI